MNKIIVKKSEKVTLPVLWLGGKQEIAYDIFLDEPGASVRLLALLVGREKNSLDFKINVFHRAKETRSEVVVKGILGDSSEVDFRGLVRIDKEAKGSNAYLSSKLLLFSKEAKGEVVPSLEILENDVKAGHAASVGRVNEEELFYLMSRGLSRKQAKQLIVQGFLTSILEDFPKDLSEKAREELKYV